MISASESKGRKLSEGTQRYRQLMWVFAAVALFCIWSLVQASRHGRSGPIGLYWIGLIGSLAALTSSFLRAHRAALAEREREGRTAMLMMVAAELGHRDDETLEKVARSKGLPAEAARMILANRLAKRAPPPPSP